MTGDYQAVGLTSADQVIPGCFGILFLGEPRLSLSLGLVMWGSAEVIPFGGLLSCLLMPAICQAPCLRFLIQNWLYELSAFITMPVLETRT